LGAGAEKWGRFMRSSWIEIEDDGDEEIIHTGINKDVLFLLWFLFLLFHRPLFITIGAIFGFLVGADGVFPLVPGAGYKSVMD
jgi:hypothetical protein